MKASIRLLGALARIVLLILAAAWGLSGAAAGPSAAASGASPWGAEYFPNVPLVTQDGRKVRFFDDLIAGRVVAINFIFTGCSASCPLETARLREVQRLLGERMGKDVFFYSISLDPENDTPETLAAYAAKFDVGPGWTFLTGKTEDIVLLRQKLGLYLPDVRDNKTDHNLSLIIGNQSTGRWQKASPFENPHILANHLGYTLHNWKVANPRNGDYANAPTRLRNLSRGEDLFRTRCASCHTLGADAGSLAALQRIGPDLAGVTARRERAWLRRWIKEPDRMLAEKDALAVSLYESYKRVPMPNLYLSEVDIDALLGFLDEQPAALAAREHVARD